ncbi:penicillin-binding protein 2 [Rhizobium sp. RM]|uniref:peptidoglycan D,D-transpeptidase FtsI family protein n=1 Tax=Rhizobium sp. RM TaxID=2748079 RepID=UPI00110E0E05|nr:penicillin-binding protein 2 [Rhizobium sp. RM]NWJ23077.1 penicillin-binding protein 2 [Rhizobium sp. RM]TMV22011.1 penicillin-binding protein 2 [Rhizobium sp. Td3]
MSLIARTRKGAIGKLVLSPKKPRRTSPVRHRQRVALLFAAFAIGYGVIAARLVHYGQVSESDTTASIPRSPGAIASRPDIVDRHGQLIATDVNLVSLYAEPRRVVDPNEAIEKLASVIPGLDWADLHRKLTSDTGFQWIRRQLTPRQQAEIMRLGIPGIGFRPEKRRFYPGGPVASHIVGHVNIDNQGLAGIERYLDRQGLADLRDIGLADATDLKPVRLSIDLRVQSIVHTVVVDAMRNYQAEAAGAVVIDVDTGEVLAMASAPDYDPNEPSRRLADGAIDKDYEKGWFNRMSNSAVEMGSTFKAFTLAMGLDAGVVGLNSVIDASRPLKMGGFLIRDFHGRGRPLTIREVFRYSSNIGTAKVADLVGLDNHQRFLSRLGLLSRLQTELPEVASPTAPRHWKKINSATISFGHGLATTPLQTAAAAAALVNGGMFRHPTFIAGSNARSQMDGTRVIEAATSAKMRELFAYNGTQGSGRNAQVAGFDVGGKTGTAEKVINGRYAKNLNFNTFLAAFPMHRPRYVVLTIIDAPLSGERGGRLAAYNAAPMVRDIITRAAPLLGVRPSFGDQKASPLMNY